MRIRQGWRRGGGIRYREIFGWDWGGYDEAQSRAKFNNVRGLDMTGKKSRRAYFIDEIGAAAFNTAFTLMLAKRQKEAISQ